jgi:elongation factor P
MDYVYQDGDGVILLDPETDELLTLPHEQAGDALLYLREGDRVHLVLGDGLPLALEPPSVVELTVADIDPPLPGSAAPRSALLETGLKIMVPASARVGDRVIVDTRGGSNVGRATPHAAG